jgi:hypothetical protein
VNRNDESIVTNLIGMHTFEEFEDYLMNTRKSYRNEEEWRADAGPVDPTKHKKDDGGD